jgi:RimJ/RimL family protein N-acetyltransferase
MAGTMIDTELSWSTDRLRVEPLTSDHTAELLPMFSEPKLYEFIGGWPLSQPELTERFARWVAGLSPDGTERWCNWVLRDREAGAVVGMVQATMPVDGQAAGPAHVAWMVRLSAQGRGYATEAATSLVDRLLGDGWAVVAAIHPDHAASQRVARHAGLRPTELIVDGEVRWERPAEPGPAPQS